ncbi:MAG: 2-hydroxychromene-2-carboxylate isomerase [Pseudomonadota bacterium]
MPPTIDFYFSIDSRYSYLAATQMPVLEAGFGAQVRWRPLRLSALLAARGASPFEGRPVSGQYEAAYRDTDTARWAAYYGVPIVSPDWGKGDWERMNMAAVAAAVEGCCPAFVRALYGAVMVRNAIPETDAAIRRIADAAGLPGARIVAGIDARETAQRHGAHIEAALKAGVFGVPSFVADGEMFWGNDRLVLLRHLLETKAAKGSR